MEAMFMKLLDMSVSAMWLMAAVLILRPLLKKYSAMLCMVAWALVAIRLVCPFTIESDLSLIPDAQPITTTVSSAVPAASDIGESLVDQAPVGSMTPNVGDSVDPIQVVTAASSVVWFVGTIGMLVYGAIGVWRIYCRTCTAVPMEEGVWMGDEIETPFIVGVFRPRIYIPSDLPKEHCAWVIAHERSHIRWGDAIFKPLGYLILILHWFNPLVWVCYILFCRDMESACDERVISKLSVDDRKTYSQALLACSHPRRLQLAPLAFGEVNVKQRIKAVLHYKRPALWIAIAACVLLGLVILFWFCDPVSTIDPTLDAQITQWNLEENKGDYLQGDVAVEHHEVLGTSKRGDEITVYMWVLYQEYSQSGNEVKEVSGGYYPAAVTVQKDGDTYALTEYWIAEDGANYVSSIREKYPIRLWAKVFVSPPSYDRQYEYCYAQALQLLNSSTTQADETVLYATVKEIYDTTMLVEPLQGAPVSGEVSLSTEKCPDPLAVGDMVAIFYDGMVQETYPLQIGNVYRIQLIEFHEESISTATTAVVEQPSSASAYDYVTIDENNGFDVVSFNGESIASHRGVASTPSVAFLTDSIVGVSWQEGADTMTCYFDLENNGGTEAYTNVLCEQGETIYYTEQLRDGCYLVKRKVFPRTSLRQDVLLEEAVGEYPVKSLTVDEAGGITVRYFIGNGTALRTLTLSKALEIVSSTDQQEEAVVYAVVEELHDGSALVQITEGQEVNAGPLWLYYDTIAQIARDGDTVAIYYDGRILETYPPQIYAIRVQTVG